MSSVTKYIDCPNCGSPNKCLSEYSIHSKSEYRLCYECGYTKDTRFKNTGINEENFNPYGTYTIIHQYNIEEVGGLSSENELDYLISRMQDDFNIKAIIISRYINGKIIKYDLIRQIKLKKICSKLGI